MLACPALNAGLEFIVMLPVAVQLLAGLVTTTVSGYVPDGAGPKTGLEMLVALK